MPVRHASVQSPRVSAKKKEGERDFCCARMKNERVLILLLQRDVVRLSNQCDHPERAPDEMHLRCSRELVGLH